MSNDCKTCAEAQYFVAAAGVDEHTWVNAEDAARELDKAYDVLFDAYTYLITTDQANATRHLAKETRPSPLTIRVRTATEEARRAADRFRCKHD